MCEWVYKLSYLYCDCLAETEPIDMSICWHIHIFMFIYFWLIAKPFYNTNLLLVLKQCSFNNLQTHTHWYIHVCVYRRTLSSTTSHIRICHHNTHTAVTNFKMFLTNMLNCQITFSTLVIRLYEINMAHSKLLTNEFSMIYKHCVCVCLYCVWVYGFIFKFFFLPNLVFLQLDIFEHTKFQMNFFLLFSTQISFNNLIGLQGFYIMSRVCCCLLDF